LRHSVVPATPINVTASPAWASGRGNGAGGERAKPALVEIDDAGGGEPGGARRRRSRRDARRGKGEDGEGGDSRDAKAGAKGAQRSTALALLPGQPRAEGHQHQEREEDRAKVAAK